MDKAITPTVFSSPLLLSGTSLLPAFPTLYTDEEIAKLGIGQDDYEIYRRKQYTASFGITTWYDALKEHTFRTVHVPITYEEGQAIIVAHQLHERMRMKHLDLFKTTMTDADIEVSKEILVKLEVRLAKHLVAFPGGAFVKLNTRSPKDVPVNNDEDPEVVAKVMAEMAPAGQRSQDAVCQAYVIGTNKYLRLLTRSDRITEDLRKLTQFPAKLFDTSIVIREWLEGAPTRVAYEFRGFVHKNRLNALTQYFDFFYCEDLHKNKDAIGEQIQKFYYSINSRITHESYVIDFLVLQDRILIIELNPFHNGAGASLFSWGKDRELFLNGPFCFRVQTSPNPKQGDGILTKKWTQLIDSPNKLEEVNSKEEEAAAVEPEAQQRWNCVII